MDCQTVAPMKRDLPKSLVSLECVTRQGQTEDEGKKPEQQVNECH